VPKGFGKGIRTRRRIENDCTERAPLLRIPIRNALEHESGHGVHYPNGSLKLIPELRDPCSPG